MAVHFIHIGKTGGTAIKHVLRSMPDHTTPYGPVKIHTHQYRLRNLGPDDRVMFVMRDPVARFVSGFYSRYRRGQPRYNYEWTDPEKVAFAKYTSPRQLASDLADGLPEAEEAMRSIRHVRTKAMWWLGKPVDLLLRVDQIAYIGRQETLNDDWVSMRSVLGLPDHLELPKDDVAAHRTSGVNDRKLNLRERLAIIHWYRQDYALIEVCEQFRRERGWPSAS